MFQDGFYSAVEGLDAFGFSSNLRGGKTATNLTPSSARASAASFGLVARKTETNLTRTNLANLAVPSKQNARINLSSNLRTSETVTSKTFG